MDIAIFGGSFNPVHMGHHEIVRNLVQNMGVSKLIIVPTYQNPLKSLPPVIPEFIRWQMLKQTFQAFDSVEISDFELQNQKMSYSYKTVIHYKKQYPHDHLFLILGEDTFAAFPQWAEIETILNLSEILVFPRRQSREPESSIPFFHGFVQHVTWLDIEVPHISATQIRNSDLKKVAEKRWLHPEAHKIWQHYQQSLT